MTVNASKDWVQQLYVQETNKKSPEPDFYKDDSGNIVMTESFHMNEVNVVETIVGIVPTNHFTKKVIQT